jgi:hypothetical protein
MNERIREVWIKAAREDPGPDNWDTQEQFIERFAELIIQECVSFCEYEPNDDMYDQFDMGMNCQANTIRGRIKHLFGVQE